MVTKLYPFQKEDVQQIHRFFGRALLANEMGTGKTIEALAYIHYCMKGQGPFIVVCPAGIKWNWKNECLKHFNLYSEVLESNRVPTRFGRGNPRNTIYIINYDILKSWWETLRKLKPALIIGDEIHYCKSREAKRTKYFRYLCEGIPHIILMSGTPLTNRPTELWPALNILKPQRYPTFFTFANRYSHRVETRWGTKYLGAQRLDELHADLKKRVMIRRTKAEVLKDLPKKTRTVLPIDLRGIKEYEKAEQDFVRWLRQTHPDRKNIERRANRLAKMQALKVLVGRLKLTQIEEWIDNFLEEGTGKLIVFGIHHYVLETLHAQYKNSVLVTGKVKGRERQAQYDKFTKDKNIRQLFGNMIAAGIGWPGTAANTVLFAELDWVPGNHIQAEDRPHRIGQTMPVNCFYLVARNTIEEMLIRIIQKKQEDLDQVLDGKKGVSGMDVHDQLEYMLLNEKYRNIGMKLNTA